MCEYWSRSNHLSYVGKTRGKSSELFTSFFSFFQHFFFPLGEDVCYMFSYDWSVVFKATMVDTS